MKSLHRFIDLPIRRGLAKTIRHPMTYISALIVGGLSMYSRDYQWGVATPFVVPLLIQGLTRVVAEYDHQAADKNNVQ